MNILMGTTLSFFLSLSGLLSSGNFTLPSFALNFAVSLVISLVLGILVPMGKVSAGINRKLKLSPKSLKSRLIQALASDIIYTPLMTFIMVTMAYKSAVKHGAEIFYPAMLGKAMLISLPLGYVLSFVFMPVFLKLITKNAPPQSS